MNIVQYDREIANPNAIQHYIMVQPTLVTGMLKKKDYGAVRPPSNAKKCFKILCAYLLTR